MSRLSRFEEYRFVGARDTMIAYDCDDPDQFSALKRRVQGHGLDRRNLLQAFAPDELREAVNRSFRPHRRDTVS